MKLAAELFSFNLSGKEYNKPSLNAYCRKKLNRNLNSICPVGWAVEYTDCNPAEG